MNPTRPSVYFLILSIMLIGLPVLGVWWHGADVTAYFEFPPRTRFVEHAPFSWPAFVLVATQAVVALALIGYLLSGRRSVRHNGAGDAPGELPWWGWLAGAWLALVWLLAWTRFAWFAPLQEHTFAPLWTGYIVFVNALTYRAKGRCLLTHQPLFLLTLFPVSSVFWWYFEYLNRFVQNWYYLGIAEWSAWRYTWQASISFATVLPAVVSTEQWLKSFAWLNQPRRKPRPRLGSGNLWAWAGLLIAAAGLLGIGTWPNQLYPLVWVAPLLLVLALQQLSGQRSYLAPLRTGDYRIIYLPALSALVCGVLWELWNAHSLAQWRYAIPYVHRFQVFEMPLLGYTGYLPFGLECAVIADIVRRRLDDAPG